MRLIKSLDQRGFALLPFIVVFPFLILLTASFLALSVNSLNLAKRDQRQTHAQFATDAGIEVAMEEMNENEAWTGSSGQVEVHNDGSTRTTYEVSVATIDDDNKTITSVGRSFSPVSSTTPSSSVTVKVNLRPVRSGEYSVVSGVGGLFLSNSAKIVGGDVLVNGEIGIKNSAQIGLTTNPVTVEVAHQTCPDPANASYPQLCASGENGEPITIENSAHIYGSVTANNQTTASGMSNPGLVGSSGVTAQALPTHDRNAQKSAVTSTITSTSASCSSGTKTWTANLKITGNVSVSGSCQVTVNGNVWITGTLDVQNSAKLIVNNSLGATRPDIMVDGAYAKMKNSSTLQSNSSGTGFRLLTYSSTASCSPDCADVTGTDLYNSRDDTTIELSNSASGPETIFYARWTRVVIENSGQLGALVGQTVELKNSGTITFGTSTGTGSTYWVIDSYRRSF